MIRNILSSRLSTRRRRTRGVSFLHALTAAACTLAPAAALAQPGTTYKPSRDAGKPAERPSGKATRPSGSQREKLREEGKGLFSAAAAPDESVNASWSIVLAAFRDENQAAAAAQALDTVRNSAGLTEAYTQRRGAATVVAYGRYATQQAGEKDLDRVRSAEVVIDGQKQRIFTGAFLAPPSEVKGTIPEFDLRNVRAAKPWVIYTLQVGNYGRQDKPATGPEIQEFRKAAEQAAIQLRREGEEAYYFHGSASSMVTIGAFASEDFDVQAGITAPAIEQLRKRFPYNLHNGQGVRRTVTIRDPKSGKVFRKERIDPSGLVVVPKD